MALGFEEADGAGEGLQVVLGCTMGVERDNGDCAMTEVPAPPPHPLKMGSKMKQATTNSHATRATLRWFRDMRP